MKCHMCENEAKIELKAFMLPSGDMGYLVDPLFFCSERCINEFIKRMDEVEKEACT